MEQSWWRLGIVLCCSLPLGVVGRMSIFVISVAYFVRAWELIRRCELACGITCIENCLGSLGR